MVRRGERGAGRAKAIFWLAVLVLLIYALFKIAPAFINNYELEDFMATEARFASAGSRTEPEVRENLWRKLGELDLPVGKEDIKYSKSGRRVQISIQYTVQIELLFYTLNLNFHPQVDNRGV